MAAPSVDQRGVRFEHEGRVFRAFRGDVAPFYRSLLESPTAERLFEAGLVRSWISELRVEGFDLVVESERVPVVSYPMEWPTAVLREAGLVIARLGRALADAGLGLHDAHPWNVLFNGARGIWIDLGSLVDRSEVSPAWHREFRAHVVMPLALHSIGWHSAADAVVAVHQVVGTKAKWDAGWLRLLFPWRVARMERLRREPRRYYGGLVEYLERMPARPSKSAWSGYVQAPGAVVGEAAGYDGKQRAVATFLSTLPPGRVLDVGANAGWFSELAVHHGNMITAIDADDMTLSALFDRAKRRGLPILPLRMDIMSPTPGHGLGLAYAPASERLRSDTSMWLAVLHHLARDGHTFDTVARTIRDLSADAAIVEFIPREDEHLRDWSVAQQPWYSEEVFIDAMKPYFPLVERLASSPAPRAMLLFRRS